MYEEDSQGEMERWRDFTEETTMHGIKYTSRSKVHIIRRLIWLVMIAGVLVYFAFAVQVIMTDYIKRTVNTRVRVSQTAELTFPTVTICNKNSWRLSSMNDSTQYLGEYWFNEIISDLYLVGRELPPPKDKYNWSSPELLPISTLRPEDTDTFLQQASHSLEQTFLSCRWQRKEINCSQVLKQVKTDAGYCYQFNSDGEFLVQSAGVSGGLSFLLDTVTHEYSVGPYSFAEGFYLTFHETYEVPLVTELGVGVEPGVQASIMLQKSETIREPPPADDNKADCLDLKQFPNPLHFYKNYSHSACYTECKAQYVLKRCGCRDLLQPAMNNSKTCLLPEMLYCSSPALGNFTLDPEGLRACDCPHPCFETEYTAKVSNFKFPSPMYVSMMGLDEATIEYVRRNYVMVDIFFGKMSYHQLEEFVAYGEVEMLASFGGTLGVCIGASCLTIAEFVEQAIFFLLRCCVRLKRQGSKLAKGTVIPAKLASQVGEGNKQALSMTYDAGILPKYDIDSRLPSVD